MPYLPLSRPAEVIGQCAGGIILSICANALTRKCPLGYIPLLLLLAACSGPNTDALATEHATLAAGLNDLRATATYAWDRLQVTIEFAETAVQSAADQRIELSVTLQAAGVDPTAIARVSPGPLILPTPTVTTTPAPIAPGTTASPVATLSTDALIIPTATAGQPGLYNAVMAQGVGDNDCALAAMNRFSTTAERIYIVAAADNIAPETTLGAQWLRDDQLLVAHDFTPDFAIKQNCVWFFVDPTDFPFEPGNYLVQLTLNGQPAGSPVPFVIAP